MIIVDRVRVTDTNLTDSNLIEDDAPEWDVATTYAANDEVRVTAFHRVYVSADDANVGNPPPAGGDANWILKGATNKWAAFDDFVANRTQNEDVIEYEFTVQSKVTSISFFGLTAESIVVTVSKDANTITYTETLQSFDHINGSWWNWFTGGRPSVSEFAFLDIAYFGPGTVINVSINRPDQMAAVGQIVIGSSVEIGFVETMPEIDKQDFTRYEEDAFGNISVVPRLPAKLTRMTVFNQSGNVRATENVLDRNIGQFTVFIGTAEPELGLILFGILRSAPITIETRFAHRIRITVRSLI